MVKSTGRLFAYSVLLVLMFLGWIRLLPTTQGYLGQLELFAFIILLALTVGGLVGYRSWGERVLFWVFLFYLMNLLGLWFLLGSISVVLLVLALIGFILALPSRSPVRKEEPSEEPHSEVFEPAKSESKVEEKKVVEKKATFTPGKYVASNKSNVYHAPKCEWANNIKKGNRLWFESKEDAESKQYRKHSCVN